MLPASYAAAIDREGRAVVEAATANLDAPVPACPGWVVANVVGHLGRVHRSVASIVESRSTEPPATKPPAPPEGDEVIAFFESGLERLLTALADIDLATPIYTWSDDDNTATFYLRRMAHEIAIHRYDVQVAVLEHGGPEALGGRKVPDPIDADLAVDGIDELYDLVLPFSLRRRERPLPTASMHLHRTDGDGEWLIRSDGSRLVVTREHAKGDVAVRGPASDLLVFVWNRGRADTLEFFGDEAAAAAWADLAP